MDHSIEIQITNKKIVSVAMGDNFLVILTKCGQLYSMGTQNAFGQLGHNNKSQQLIPKLIENIKNEKIV